MWFLCQRSPSESVVYGVGRTCEVDGDWVGGLGGFDVRVKLLDIHDGDGLEDGDIERGCSKG